MIYCQVNTDDYDGQIVIEAVNHYPTGPAVPPWDEWGRPGLSGDVIDYTEHNGVSYPIGFHWSSFDAAFNALAEEAALGDGIGIYTAHVRDCPPFDQ